jgi:hypothetical protein
MCWRKDAMERNFFFPLHFFKILKDNLKIKKKRKSLGNKLIIRV